MQATFYFTGAQCLADKYLRQWYTTALSHFHQMRCKYHRKLSNGVQIRRIIQKSSTLFLNSYYFRSCFGSILEVTGDILRKGITAFYLHETLKDLMLLANTHLQNIGTSLNDNLHTHKHRLSEPGK